ncbi:MAG: NAD(P)-binding domain-containing protein [Acidimicrobiales bacterium]
MPKSTSAYDLVIVGGSASGLSVAVSSLRSGLGLIRIIESSTAVAFPELVGPNQLDVGYGETVSSVDVDGDLLVVTSNKQTYRTTAVLIADRRPVANWKPPIPVVDSPRIHIDSCNVHDDDDVLVVGFTDHAVELTATMAAGGARVVLAAGGLDPDKLSPAGESILRRLERERRATLLYRSVPDQIGEAAGFPMAYFSDRRTPDLQFDHVVFASARTNLGPGDVGATAAAVASGHLFFVGEPTADSTAPTVPGWRVGTAIAEACFPELQLPERPTSIEKRQRHGGFIAELREEHYNATITHFEPTHSDWWVLRVRPDQGDTSHLPGQYASLGLGYWEARSTTPSTQTRRQHRDS